LTDSIRKFDVFILIYKNLNLIGDLLESLSHQVDLIDRVVISSDSPDTESVNEINSILKKYSKIYDTDIVVRSNRKNLGVANHVMSLNKYIKSRYILLIGADDYICKSYFKVMLNFLEENAQDEYTILTPNQYFVDCHSKVLRKTSRNQSDIKNLSNAIKMENFGVPYAGSLICSNIIKNIRYYKGTINEDDQIIVKGMLIGKRAIIPEHIFFYRVGVNSLSSWYRNPFLPKSSLKKLIASEAKNRRAQNIGWLNLIRKEPASEERNALINLCRINLRWYNFHLSSLGCFAYLSITLFLFRISAFYRLMRYRIGNILHVLKLRFHANVALRTQLKQSGCD